MKIEEQTSDILDKPIEWQTYYLKCEKIKSDLVVNTKDLRFLQQLLDRYFDEMIKIENLDEMRESLMRFQDLCYNCDRLKKRVKDQQSRILDIMKRTTKNALNVCIEEQSTIEKLVSVFMKDFKMVKKEMLAIAEHAVQGTKENEGLVSR